MRADVNKSSDTDIAYQTGRFQNKVYPLFYFIQLKNFTFLQRQLRIAKVIIEIIVVSIDSSRLKSFYKKLNKNDMDSSPYF